MLISIRRLLAIAMISISGSEGSELEPKDIIGSWVCEPYVMEGKGLKVTVRETFSYHKTNIYTDLVLTVIEFENGNKVSTQSTTDGTWSLAGNVIHTIFRQSKVLSTDNPSYPIDLLQKSTDEQLQRKNWSKSEVIEAGSRLVTKPIQPMYEEANVTTNCKRV